MRDTKLEQARIDTELAVLRNLGMDDDVSKLERKVELLEQHIREIMLIKEKINKHI